jgi:hypothetical protein
VGVAVAALAPQFASHIRHFLQSRRPGRPLLLQR